MKINLLYCILPKNQRKITVLTLKFLSRS